MTYVFPDWSVTTWGRDAWRARKGEQVADFSASRQAPLLELIYLGSLALGLPISDNLADIAESGDFGE